MSLRQKFEFAYPVAKLLPLCENSVKYHRAREVHYQQECTAAERDLLENGILSTCGGKNEVQKHYDCSMSGTVYPGYVCSGIPYQPISANARPVIDEKKVQRVNAAKAKIYEHSNRACEFEQYANMFKAAICLDDKKSILLDAEDVRFFRIGAEEQPEKRRRTIMK
jgi:hypothetical protein